MRADSIVAVGTLVLVVLTVLTLHNGFVTGGVAVLGGGIAVAVLITSAADKSRRRQRTLNRLAKRIEKGRSVDGEPLPEVRDPKHLLDDLATLLKENERLCVIRLRGKDIIEALPGIANDVIPKSIECQRIVGEISWKLQEAPGLGEDEKTEAAVDLRDVVRVSLREKGSPAELRQDVVSLLRDCDLTDRLVPLVDAQKKSLDDSAGRWLVELFKELGCTFGVFTQESGDDRPPPRHIGLHAARQYVSGMLSVWISEQEFNSYFTALCAAVDSPQGLDLDLLKIRCAVIAAAADLRAITEPRERLLHPASPSFSAPDERAREAALEVRWLIDRKAALVGGVPDLTGVFDRLAVIDQVTLTMFRELMRHLGMGEEGTKELYEWLRGDELQVAGIIDRTEDAISLGQRIRDAALPWLRDGEQSAAYEAAQIAAERCYRVCLVLDRTHVPAAGYADWVAPGYAGIHRYEIPAWWRNVYVWSGHVAEIHSPEPRRDAAVALTCLFLESWWWYGDQPRPAFFDEVLGLARTILRDEPAWIQALEEFDRNYEPELELRAAAGDRWPRVADALGFLAGQLGLSHGAIPTDPVLARIYVCWCFFSGDVAEQAGRLDAADAYFREAARACGDAEDNAAMRLFARYQQADLWIPADTDRSLRLITENHLDKVADKLHDLSVRAYVARMYGDIRWKEANLDEAFDAYGRAVLLTYVYQARQELDKLPPSEYTYSLYKEMRKRFLDRLGEARESGHASEAAAAVGRIKQLFGPYWELPRAATSSGEDPLANVVPPLPDKGILDTSGSSYARDALLMLDDKLKDRIAEPADQLL